jgi:alkylation response protein AidB-like acyl-CoA dehydrogenase
MVARLQARGRFDDPVIRTAPARPCRPARPRGCWSTAWSTSAHAACRPSADANLARVSVISADHAVADFALDFLPDTFTGDDFPMHLAHHERAIAAGIASGAAEIQLNLVAHEYLRLPREARA